MFRSDGLPMRMRPRASASEDVSSPAIEAGSPVSLPVGERDLAGALRIQDADHDLVARVDIGSFEFSSDFDGDGILDWLDADDDNDDMPDDYETAQGFNPYDPEDADDDDDRDGFTNLEEYLAGTDPLNRYSYPGRKSRTFLYFQIMQGAM